jgi:hypothetical protein
MVHKREFLTRIEGYCILQGNPLHYRHGSIAMHTWERNMTTEQKETLIGWLGLALLILPIIIL